VEFVRVGWRVIFSSLGEGVGMGWSWSGCGSDGEMAMGGSESERGMGRSSVLVRVVFAWGFVSLNGSFLEEVGEMLTLPGVLLRVLSLGGVNGNGFFELTLSGVAGGDVSTPL